MVELNEDLSYEEYPVAIVDRQVRQLRTKDIPMVKVLWSNHSTEECTWQTILESGMGTHVGAQTDMRFCRTDEMRNAPKICSD